MSSSKNMLMDQGWTLVSKVSTDAQVNAMINLGAELKKPWTSGGRFQDVDVTFIVENFRRMIPDSALGFLGFSCSMMTLLSAVSALVCGASLLGAGALVVAGGVVAGAAVAVGVSFLVTAWIAGGFAVVAGSAWGSLQAAKAGILAAYHAVGIGAALMEFSMAAGKPRPPPRSSAVLVPDTYADQPPRRAANSDLSSGDEAMADATNGPVKKKKKEKKGGSAGSRAGAHAAAAGLLRALDKEG